MESQAQAFLPLPPAALHVLLALAGEDRHGYGIMQEVARQSGGRHKLGPGTLYDNLQRLTAQGIVEEVNAHGETNPRRRYYRLSPLGRQVLTAETDRLEEVVRQARLRLAQREPGRV